MYYLKCMIIAPQALLRKQPKTVEERRFAEKECRRSSIKQLLRRIGGSSGDLHLRRFAKHYHVSSAESGPASLQIELKSVR